ncbi:Two-component response regulator CreB [Klebsiella pneumoniae IS22]|nr:Two-component response regulator CreB [Klebsiella pneumoniae IS22]
MQQPRIWLVEDEQSIADTLVYMLQQEGFQVSVFGRGLPALEAAAHQAPDVAILDVGLPDISGFELCRRLLTRYPALPVLFLTARSERSISCWGWKSALTIISPSRFHHAKSARGCEPCCGGCRSLPRHRRWYASANLCSMSRRRRSAGSASR